MIALTIQALRKVYPNGVEALRGINLTVEEGDFFGLLGPNGAGKSTSINIVASLVRKTSGEVKIFGYDTELETRKAKAKLGLVPQEFNFNVFERVIDILVNQAGYYGVTERVAKERAEYYLRRLGLWDKAFEQARFLSGGLKRRLIIARGLIHSPALLILDEPTAGVDVELRRGIWAFLEEINRKGTTIILTTHNLEEAESLCEQVAIIHRGQIIENTTVKSLIAKLDSEILVLDLKSPILTAPEITGFEFTLIDPMTVEVRVQRESHINSLFGELTRLGYEVVSLRNKSNRLEQFFLDKVNGG